MFICTMRCVSFSFSITATATTNISTLSLHDALPISHSAAESTPGTPYIRSRSCRVTEFFRVLNFTIEAGSLQLKLRSEEHTSELQSHHEIVCRLLLEQKKHKKFKTTYMSY